MQCIVWQPSAIWMKRRRKNKAMRRMNDGWLFISCHGSSITVMLPLLFFPFLFWLLTGKFYGTLSVSCHSIPFHLIMFEWWKHFSVGFLKCYSWKWLLMMYSWKCVFLIFSFLIIRQIYNASNIKFFVFFVRSFIRF